MTTEDTTTKTKQTDASTMANAPIEVEIGGQSLKLAELTLGEIFAHFEARVKSEKIREAQEMADGMSDVDRLGFLTEAWRNLPAGKMLQALAHQAMTTALGIAEVVYLAAKKYTPDIERDAVQALLSMENLDELAPLINRLIGIDAKPKSETSAEKKASNPRSRKR